MPDVDGDLRAMIAASDFGDDRKVTLASGAVIFATPCIATMDDSLKSDAIFSGITRCLRFVTADIPGLTEGAGGTRLTWKGKLWGINAAILEANGHVTAAFLGEP